MKQGITRLETFTQLKALSKNPDYQLQRKKQLDGFNADGLDRPIADLIRRLNRLPHCFTLQSCYGHFVYSGQKDANNLEPLPKKDIIAKVEYRIAYIAFCIENSLMGRELFESLKKITAIDSEYVQFCCAEWFWKRQVNSYALQVEPDRFKREDTATVNYREALYIEKVRNDFFTQLYELLEDAGEM